MWGHDSKRGQGATLWCGASRGQELMIFSHILTHPDPNTKALGPILEPSWESSEHDNLNKKRNDIHNTFNNHDDIHNHINDDTHNTSIHNNMNNIIINNTNDNRSNNTSKDHNHICPDRLDFLLSEIRAGGWVPGFFAPQNPGRDRLDFLLSEIRAGDRIGPPSRRDLCGDLWKKKILIWI